MTDTVIDVVAVAIGGAALVLIGKYSKERIGTNKTLTHDG